MSSIKDITILTTCGGQIRVSLLTLITTAHLILDALDKLIQLSLSQMHTPTMKSEVIALQTVYLFIQAKGISTLPTFFACLVWCAKLYILCICLHFFLLDSHSL